MEGKVMTTTNKNGKGKNGKGTTIIETVSREIVSETVKVVSELRAGTVYTRDSIKALFARNDSNLHTPAGQLKVSDNVTHSLYKCGDFAGNRVWFVPVCEGFQCIGTSEKIGAFWYENAQGTAHKTRDAVLKANVKKYLI
jgi:hypothetical protein